METQRERFVTKKAMKKAKALEREEAERKAIAEREAFVLRRKEDKKARRHQEQFAKAHREHAVRIQRAFRRLRARWELAALQASRQHAIRIQCAFRRLRRLRARQELAALHQREAQLKHFRVLKSWRQILHRCLRNVDDLSCLLQAAAAAHALPPPCLAEAPTTPEKSSPRSVKDALVEGKWTLARQSNHYVYKRGVVMANGNFKIQTTTVCKTPSDRRSHSNQLAKLRGKFADGVVRCLSFSSSDEECSNIAAHWNAPTRRPLETLDVTVSHRPEYEEDPSSPQNLIIHATLLAFQAGMHRYCPTFQQKKRVLSFLKELRARLKTLEAPARTARPREEQNEYWAPASGRLDDKLAWLNEEMMEMLEREQLTADELHSLEAKLLRQEAQHEAGGCRSPKSAARLRDQLQLVRNAKPHVWPVERAAEIAVLEKKIAKLTALENPKQPLELDELLKLNAKPQLVEKLAALRAAGRGWFADA